LLISLLAVVLAPLFIGSWRASLWGLAGQGGLMALIAYRQPQALAAATGWLVLLDLFVIRSAWMPLTLYRVLHARSARARIDVIPPDLLSWAIAIGLVLVSFSFAGKLVTPPGEQQTLVAVCASALLLGLFVLATRTDPLNQVLGALRVENAIALFELGGDRHESALFVQLGLMAVFAATVVLFARHLSVSRFEGPRATPAEAEAEGPTL
jgi:hydrogenase-4 membrane subunit HyfE